LHDERGFREAWPPDLFVPSCHRAFVIVAPVDR
jgi:hypothetical protein